MTAYETNPTETLTLTDLFTYNWTLSRTYSETLTLTDGDIYLTSIDLTETLTLTDDLITGVSRILSETITLTDDLILDIGKVLLETITLSDTYSRVWDATEIYSEALGLTDSPTLGISRALTETITFTDSHTRGKIFSETITLSDGDIIGTDQIIKSTNGAWCGIFSSRISLATSIQNFINELDAQQIPINMMKFSCHAVIAEESVVEFNIVAIIKKH